jgi:DEAD/DEAH box helicase domain-containing protein
MADDIIVYDVETQHLFQEVGGRDPRLLKISLLGMYSYNENRYYTYTEDELPAFWRRLEYCQLLIGFNNKGFDDQVIAPYFPEITKLRSFDMLEEIVKRLGFRLSLDNLAKSNLGIGKTGDGFEAIRLYRAGEIEKLRSYCENDVKVTKEVYEFGKKNGYLSYTNLSGVKEVQVDFHPKIEDEPEPLNLSLF